MKKTLKITLISLGSLLGLMLLTVIIALWIVVTPARLTAIVRNQAPNFITCDFDMERADLTIFKTFPRLGLEIDGVVLVNPMEGSPSDTLAYINECVVAVDIMRFLKKDEIVIDECILNGGYVNLYTDAQGNANIDIFPPSEPDTIVEESSDFTYSIDLTLLKVNDLTVNYTDLTQDMMAELKGMNVLAKGNMTGENIAGEMNMSIRDILYQQDADSLMLAVKLNGLKMEGDAEMNGDDINADIDVSSSCFLYEYDGEMAEFDALNLKYKGDFNDYDIVKGDLDMSLKALSYSIDNDTLVNNIDLEFIAPVNALLNNMDIEFGKSQLAINNMAMELCGKVVMPEEDIDIDLDVNTNTLKVEELIGLIPASMREELLSGIDAKGELQLAAKIKGVYNELSMPYVDAALKYNNGVVSMPEMLPYPLTNVNTNLKLETDLDTKYDFDFDCLNANMSKTSLSLSGTINDVMDKMYCDLNVKANANLDELQSFIPEDIEAKGNVKLNVNAKVNYYQLSEMDFKKAKVNGKIQWNDMNVVYCDTVNINADRLDLNLTLPNSGSEDLANSLAMVKISGENMDAKVSDMIVASLKDYNINAQVSDIFDEKTPMSVYADYKFSRIDATMDDMNLFANNPEGNIAMYTKDNGVDASYVAVYKGDSLSFDMGEEMNFVTEMLDLNVSANYDDDQEDMLLQWNPHAGIRLDKAVFSMSGMPTSIQIPSIDFQYDSTGIEINNSSVLLGNSDFELQGKFTNVDEFIRKEALLEGELDFTSHYTDVNQLMELFSGAGDTIAVEEEMLVTDTLVEEDNPFMVPLGVDITLNTKIENAVAGKMKLSNLGGGLTVKNGVMVLQEMGFTSEAATMKVTAMYKSPRKNHLYLGLDLHLLEIDIAEMIDLIPELDTLVPMLNSFAGKAEFHFAAETYLKSNYDLKISTLRGATAIHGKDLVILDNDTYKKIGRLLGFKDKEHNKIDKLAVEITAFKNEIDVYPTLIAVDKYQAIVAGRHNLDMTFDYKVGMSNPWPFRRLGIKIGGNLDDMKYRLVGKRNLNLENPKGSDQDVHLIQETMRLKQLIYDSLK